MFLFKSVVFFPISSASFLLASTESEISKIAVREGISANYL